MSTNNNHSSRASKDILPKWLKTVNPDQSMPKISGDRLTRMMSNMSDITALTLSRRECTQVVDLQGLSKLRRLDLSGNQLKRLAGMRSVADIGMLNVSNNNLQGR
jgi:Leucine-rich repeat (LRR) protein